MNTSEEIEVNVRQLDEPNTTANPTGQVFEVLRKLMLASVGAFVLSRDETETFLNRLVERGELAQKDAQRLIDESVERMRKASQPQAAEVQTNVANLGVQVENGLEQFLNRLNIPSKRDIDELSAKIAQLAARVEELRQTQKPATTARTTTSSEQFEDGAGL